MNKGNFRIIKRVFDLLCLMIHGGAHTIHNVDLYIDIENNNTPFANSIDTLIVVLFHFSHGLMALVADV